MSYERAELQAHRYSAVDKNLISVVRNFVTTIHSPLPRFGCGSLGFRSCIVAAAYCRRSDASRILCVPSALRMKLQILWARPRLLLLLLHEFLQRTISYVREGRVEDADDRKNPGE